jgi:RHS repeat-associated protein
MFFDSLQIKHYTGPLIEETHYNAWGMTLAGISSAAIKPKYAENKYLFNGGNELQNKEFSDGSGLDWYDATFRMYDPQIGRFHQIDMLADISDCWSPYAFAYNNPILLNDPLGLLSDSSHPQVLPEVVVSAVKKSCKTCTPGSSINTSKTITEGKGPSLGFIVGGGTATATEVAATTTTVVETAPLWAPAIVPLLIVGGVVALDVWARENSNPISNIPRSTGDIPSFNPYPKPLGQPSATPALPGIPSFIDPWGEQYTLRARTSGLYPRLEWGKGQTGLKFLNKGDIWKIGTTTKGQGRYTGPFYSDTGPGLLYLSEFEGPMSQVLFVEKMKLLNYINQNKVLPPGNTKLQ